MRRLTAILFCDMAGYTALVQADEPRARRLRDRFRSVLTTAVGERGGRVLQFYGDGALCTFDSAVDATRAAGQIQRELRKEPVVDARAGIHTGDVVHDEEGVFGDGVNVAARIESLAPVGAVLLSGKVFDEIKNQPDLPARLLGRHPLKNVEDPLDVYALDLEGIHRPEDDELHLSARAGRSSVAVLPFMNMSADAENEFFADGITEELINGLAQVPGLKVSARTSSFAFKGKTDDVRRIARALGVETVLEGSVRRAGNRVRITAQLIDARDGYHLYSGTFDRSLDDVFATQDELARTLVGVLEPRFAGTPGDGMHGDGPAPWSPQRDPAAPWLRGRRPASGAYTEYLRGLYHWNRWTPEDAREAVERFRRSTEVDPDFALPWAGQAWAWAFLAALGQTDAMAAYPRAETAALQALGLDESVGEAHTALGIVNLFYHWDFEAAWERAQRGISLSPASPWPRHLQGMTALLSGEFPKAVEALEAAVRLDPLSLPLNDFLGTCLLMAGRIEEAAVQVERTLTLDPDFRSGVETLAYLRLVQDRPDDAIGEMERLPRITGDPYTGVGPRGMLLARAGRREEALECLDLLEMRKRRDPGVSLSFDRAAIRLALGEIDEALPLLDTAARERHAALLFFNVSPVWAGERNDERISEFLRGLGLPDFTGGAPQ